MSYYIKAVLMGLIGFIGFSLQASLYAAEEIKTMESTQTPASTTQHTQDRDSDRNRDIASENKLNGDAFLKKNKTQQGMVTLPSGLQYKIIRMGNGESPKDNDSVTVNYEGKLINGTEFDSSYKNHHPATFPVSGVIPGWAEALKHMKPGSEWMLYIPSELAYGERGAPGVIGPNEVLIFKVELLSVHKQ